MQAVFQHALESGRLVGVVDDADAPLRRELRGQQGTRGGGMRLVDETEVALEAVDDARVGTEQGTVGAEQMLEGRLPPRELQLGADPLLGNVANREFDEQLLEAQARELGAQLGPLDEVVEEGGLGGQTRERADESLNGQSRQALRALASEDLVELAEQGVGALPRDVHVGETERHLRRHAGLDHALPFRALLLDAHERLVHVGHVHARTHVLLRQTLETATVRTAHRGSVTARRMGVDELAQRALEHRRAEAVERLADPCRSLRYEPSSDTVWNGRMRVWAMSS